MFKKYMKAFLIACCSLFVLTGCGNNSNSNSSSSTAKTSTLDGKWEAVDFRSSVERSLGYQDFDEEKATRLNYSDGWKDLAPTLNISNNKVEFEYTAPMRTCLGNFYDYYLKKYSASTISKDGFIKARFRKLKTDLATFQSRMKYTTYDSNDNDYTVHSLLRNGKIDTKNHTITFPETPNILQLVVLSIADVTNEKTYNYSIEGDILTLTLESRDEVNDVTAYFKVKFKKVPDTKDKE